jgi:ribosome-associated heat shock protein Hsp15
MAMRIDKLLWFLRFAKTRGIAQAMVGEGHIRLNGRRIERQHQGIGVGDVLVLPLPAGVRVIEVLALPERRGPPSEAQSYYRMLDEARNNPLAAGARAPEASTASKPAL